MLASNIGMSADTGGIAGSRANWDVVEGRPSSDSGSLALVPVAKLREMEGRYGRVGPTTAQEDVDLSTALERYGRRKSRDDFGAYTEFLAGHPGAGWNAGVKVQLGEEYYRTGHFSKALAIWEEVWRERPATGKQRMLPLPFQQAVTSLANLYGRLGRMEPLRQLIAALDGIPLSGQYPQRLKEAQEGLWAMDHHPEAAFRCGPLALARIRAWEHQGVGDDLLILNSKSTINGICLTDLAQLARDLKMDYQIAFRSPGAKVIMPAVVHWKVGHYAAVVREANGLYLCEDPTFWNNTWASEATLDEEASGYFLVPAGPLPAGWRTVAPPKPGKSGVKVTPRWVIVTPRATRT